MRYQYPTPAVVLVCSLIATTMLSASSEKVLQLKKISTGIALDGIIEPVWNQADSVTDFVQLQPFAGKAPSVKTVAKLFTTEDALYCLMVCYDERKNIQKNTGKLDDSGGDIVSLMLDTFDDKRTAYKFAVTAAGVRADCRLLDDARNRDYSWDGVWFSGTKVYDWGFVIEMKILYRSIRYDGNLAAWGLDFDRWIPSRTEDIYWCRYEENEGQRISKFGKLVFENFRPAVKGLNLEVYPVGLARATYWRGTKYDVDPDAGIDIFYNPSQRLTYQLTGNPDFARTYNFARDYLAFYSWFGSELGWHALKVLDVGTSLNAFVEGNPDNQIEDITWNARPYFSLTPVNDLNIRMYVDNVYLRSARNVRQMIVGFLFSYQFLPKSWIYFAINEVRDRRDEYDAVGAPLPKRLHVTDRVGVMKVKYLYYF